MTYFVGLDVSVQDTAVCVVDEVGDLICEHKVATEPDDIAVLLTKCLLFRVRLLYSLTVHTRG